MSDSISREVVISAVKRLSLGETDATRLAMRIGDYLKRVPSAQPEWIPCSERMPEESGQYIITVKYVHVDGYEDLYAEHGEWDGDRWDMFCFGHCGEVEDIIAWMPLPEPYQGGQ